MTPPKTTTIVLVSAMTTRQSLRGARALAATSLHPAQIAQAEADDTAAQTAMQIVDLAGDLTALGGMQRLIVALPPACEVADVALITEHILDDHEGSPGAVIESIVAVVTDASIRRLLFVDSDRAGAEDMDSGEQLASVIEFATSIVCLASAGITDDERAEALSLVGHLNPTARIVSTLGGVTLSTHKAGPRKGIAAAMGRSLGWSMQLSGQRSLPLWRAEIGAYIFRDPRPFHPGRLRLALERLDVAVVGCIARSRGFVTLASRPDRVGLWATAGDVVSINPTDMSTWDAESPIGQEIVFFGRGLQTDALADTLGRCLLDDAELAEGPAQWSRFADPFPAWAAGNRHE